MVFGMSWHQFWDGPVDAHKAYRKAYDLRMESENVKAWLQGCYVYDAILANVPVLRAFSKATKPEPYHTKPYDINAEKARAKRERAERQQYEKIKDKVALFAEEFNKQRKEAAMSGNSDGD